MKEQNLSSYRDSADAKAKMSPGCPRPWDSKVNAASSYYTWASEALGPLGLTEKTASLSKWTKDTEKQTNMELKLKSPRN